MTSSDPTGKPRGAGTLRVPAPLRHRGFAWSRRNTIPKPMANDILMRAHSFLRPWRPRGVFLLGILALVVTGCGPKKAMVTGKVTLANVPLKGGTVIFTPESEYEGGGTAQIDAEGNYSLVSPKPGLMHIAVQPPTPPPF